MVLDTSLWRGRTHPEVDQYHQRGERGGEKIDGRKAEHRSRARDEGGGVGQETHDFGFSTIRV